MIETVRVMDEVRLEDGFLYFQEPFGPQRLDQMRLPKDTPAAASVN
jgi:hypothetical protein